MIRDPKIVSTSVVVRKFEALVVAERELTAEIVACLAEIERRGIHFGMGHSSLYSFCVERYGYSEGRAYRRIRAARVAHRHPQVIDLLRAGKLSLESIVLLAPHVDDNPNLIQRAIGLKTREVRTMLAAEYPDPNWPRGRWSVEPVGDGLFLLQAVVTEEQLDLIHQARDLDRHRNPSGDMAHSLAAGAKALIAETKKRRFAVTNKPRPRAEATVVDNSPTTTSVPATVRRAVAERDQYQCTFTSPDGHRCTATAFLEFDHIHPRALGGEHSAGNGRILCRPHNQYEAQRLLG